MKKTRRDLAIIEKERFNKEAKTIISKKKYFFINFDKLDAFLTRILFMEPEFMKIMSKNLRKLEM